MNRSLIPILDGYTVKERGPDWHFTCKGCGDEYVVEQQYGTNEVFIQGMKQHLTACAMRFVLAGGNA